MTKAQALALYQNNGAALAAALRLRRAAVSRWLDTEPIPRQHELELHFVLRPPGIELLPPPEPLERVPGWDKKRTRARLKAAAADKRERARQRRLAAKARAAADRQRAKAAA